MHITGESPRCQRALAVGSSSPTARFEPAARRDIPFPESMKPIRCRASFGRSGGPQERARKASSRPGGRLPGPRDSATPPTRARERKLLLKLQWPRQPSARPAGAARSVRSQRIGHRRGQRMQDAPYGAPARRPAIQAFLVARARANPAHRGEGRQENGLARPRRQSNRVGSAMSDGEYPRPPCQGLGLQSRPLPDVGQRQTQCCAMRERRRYGDQERG
jgi:hypothetical protein